MKKRLLASLLAAVMLLTILPTAALATDDTLTDPGDTEQEVVCTRTDDCPAEFHESDCPKYVALPGTIISPDETDTPAEEAADLGVEPTLVEQLADLIAALPDPADIEMMDDAQLSAVQEQIAAIENFASENGLELTSEQSSALEAVYIALVTLPTDHGSVPEASTYTTTIREDATWDTARTLSENLVIEQNVTLTIGAMVTINGDVTISGGGTIQRADEFTSGEYLDVMFYVPYDSSVTFENITVDGGAVWSTNAGEADYNSTLERGTTNSGYDAQTTYGMIYNLGGTVTLASGATLQNSDTAAVRNRGGTFNMQNGATICNIYSSSGAVSSDIDETTSISGKVVMTGGTVKCCQSANYGAAFSFWSGASMVFSGGTIENNYANKISNNTTAGGIYVAGSESSLTMSGDATIQNNYSAGYGGGVMVQEGTFTMDGGTITQNESVSYGGGIYINGTLTINDGEISENTGSGAIATGYAGTYSEEAPTIINMNGGAVQGNTGDGIYFLNNQPCVLNINNGVEIKDNTEQGIEAGSGTTINMDGGTISGNLGGVKVTGVFNMRGGSITKNIVPSTSSDTNCGGGVRVNAGGVFNLYDGTISENVNARANGGGGIQITGSKDSKTGAITYGTLNMYGGNILNNKVTSAPGGGGICLRNYGIANISGGEISGNVVGKSQQGGGIRLADATAQLNISGNPVITNNTRGTVNIETGDVADAAANNVYLATDTSITLTGALTGGAVIGVTTQTTPNSSGSNPPVQVTATETETDYYMNAAQHFIPDAANVVSRIDDSNGKFIEFAYDASASTRKTLTFNLDGINITGSPIVFLNSEVTTYSLTIISEAGYDLPLIGSIEVTSEAGEQPTMSLSPLAGVENVANLSISNITADTTITLNGVLKTPTVTTGGNITKTYDGQPITLTVTPSHGASGITYSYQWKKGNDPIESATSASYTLTGDELNVTTATYTCTVTATDKSERSANADASITVSITAAPIEGITVTGYNGPYDGQDHSVEATIPTGFQILYGTSEGEYELAIPSTRTEVGSTTVYWQVKPISGNNYTEATGSVEIQITKAAQSISYAQSRVDKYLGDTAFTNELTQTTVFGSITYSSNNTSVATVDETSGAVTIVGIGTATITASVTGDNTNYDAASASYVLNVSGYPSGNSGGSSDPSYSPVMDITGNGDVSVNPRTPSEGDEVTITVEPDRSYEVDEVIVRDRNGNRVDVTAERNGTYTFEQPRGRVTIEVTFVPTGTATFFTDVPESFWAYSEIEWAYENGYVNGTTTTTFGPNSSISRQQVWMILARLSGADPVNMAEARQWAIDNGISDGTTPGNAVTRQQLVALLYRYATLMGYANDARADLSIYPDVDAVASYAMEPMQWSVANNIVAGTTDGTLNPSGTATRAQFAVILYRFWEQIG